jgi:mannose-1-phosphate guanylyltransferase
LPVAEPQIAILAGGAGTRFWPLGRRSRPKQVLALDGDDPRPLLLATLARVEPLAAAPVLVVAPRALEGRLRALLEERAGARLLLEPRPRNTAAAVLLVAHEVHRRAPGSVVLVLPADHHVAPLGRYRAALDAMVARARRTGAVLTLGIEPEVARFVEKPSQAAARRLRCAGALWNAGTFAFRPEKLLELAAEHLPETALPLAEAFERHGQKDFEKALARAYEEIPSISIDHGVMEKIAGIEVVAADLDWDDLGSWDAVLRAGTADAAGNVVQGDVTLVDATGCLVEAVEGHVALLGVEGLVVVRTKDTVLVAPRGRGQEVRRIVERLEREGREDLLA